MARVTDVGTFPERVEVTELDNRDTRTTWLWIGDDYIEVDPVELIQNVIENCTHWLKDHEQGPGISQEELDLVTTITERF